MRVCLDTNVLVRLFVPHSPFLEILDAIISGQVTILVSTEILLEYEEVVVREFGQSRWRKIDALLRAIVHLHGAIRHIDPHFHFHVIPADADDNKFADCAIAGAADFIVTYDSHFAVLRSSGYEPQPIRPEEFVKRLDIHA